MSNAMFDVNTFNHFQTSNSDKQSTGQSSLILRQKLLKKGGPNSTGSSGSSRSYRKNNNGFKFHNFVVNQEKKACLEEQHGTKKISVSHWKKQNDDDEQDDNDVELNESSSKTPWYLLPRERRYYKPKSLDKKSFVFTRIKPSRKAPEELCELRRSKRLKKEKE